MQMLQITNIIYTENYIKKILLSIFIIFAISLFVFLGINYTGSNLTFFSGVITALVTINPLEVEVSAPAEVKINKVFKVEAKVINKGEKKIENVKGEIFLPSGLVLLKKDPVQKIGIIPSEKEKKISWSVKGEEIGNYIILVSVWGESRGYGISAEGSVEVMVKESLKGAQPQNWLQNLFDFFQKWFRF